MEPNIKKLKKIKILKKPSQYCLTCHRCGHETNVCYKLKKETKRKDEIFSKIQYIQPEDMLNIVMAFFTLGLFNKVCEVQFGYYDLRMTNYLLAEREAFELKRSEYVNHKMCQVQYSNYDDRMSNYLLRVCD